MSKDSSGSRWSLDILVKWEFDMQVEYVNLGGVPVQHAIEACNEYIAGSGVTIRVVGYVVSGRACIEFVGYASEVEQLAAISFLAGFRAASLTS